jgi:hypothetical protein
VKRRLFLALLGLSGARKASSQQIPGLTDEFANRILEFDKKWIEFLRRMAGCDLKKKVITEEDCRISKRELHLKSFQEAGEAAYKLWPPEEK